MKNGRLQCKDIDERPILEMLSRATRWSLLLSRKFPDDLLHAFPLDVDRRLAVAKMNTLGRRGLVTGCFCGCRGDFEIAEKGREYLKPLGEPKQ